MDKLTAKFLEEATEHLQRTEQHMLMLENDPEDKDCIEVIFRTMHTLKGAGSMFGYEKISEVSQELEFLYDEIRHGKRTATHTVFDLTLKAVDHLKTLLKVGKDISGEVIRNHESLLRQIRESVCLAGTQETAGSMKSLSDTGTETEKKDRTYYVSFKPHESIFDNGTNPLFLIDELAALGSSLVLPCMNDVPDLDSIDPAKCYTFWEIFLVTDAEISTIRDVFLFVEDLCVLDIQKISDRNLLQEKRFTRKIEKRHQKGNNIGISEAIIFANELENPVSQKVKKAVTDTHTGLAEDFSISSVRVSSDRLDRLMKLISELVTTQSRLSLYAKTARSSELTAITKTTEKLSRQLRDLTFEIALVPIDTLVPRFQHLVRDLSRELGKKVIFESRGTETELDKTIVEHLSDPLMHIIRNCMDHGIESSETRLSLGKPAYGRIVLHAYHSSTNVYIEIMDDGAGLDPDTIRAMALQKGLITEETTLNDKELHALIFNTGFATHDLNSGLSDHNVGMDIVRQKINALRGEISIESEKNRGTKVILKIPLTVSIVDGFLVKVSDTLYVIPLSSIEKIYAIQHGILGKTYSNHIELDGQRSPYISLRHEFQCAEPDDSMLEYIILVRYENQKVGLVVDSVIGEYQAVLKPIGRQYKNQDIISAATILGDGTVALVIDTNHVIKHLNTESAKTEMKT